MELKPDIWNTHEWYSRRLEIAPGKPQMQRYCIRCARNFVDDLWCDERYAAHAAIFHFERLADEVTARWLRETCPGIHLPSDDADRKMFKVDSAADGSGNDRVASLADKVANHAADTGADSNDRFARGLAAISGGRRSIG